MFAHFLKGNPFTNFSSSSCGLFRAKCRKHGEMRLFLFIKSCNDHFIFPLSSGNGSLQCFKLAVLTHFFDNVDTSNQLSLDVELRKRWPVGEFLQSLANLWAKIMSNQRYSNIFYPPKVINSKCLYIPSHQIIYQTNQKKCSLLARAQPSPC